MKRAMIDGRKDFPYAVVSLHERLALGASLEGTIVGLDETIMYSLTSIKESGSGWLVGWFRVCYDSVWCLLLPWNGTSAPPRNTGLLQR